MADVKRVLIVNSEIFPYLPESDIARIGRYLPQGVQERKREIRAFMPRYGCINERKNQLHEVIRLSGMNIIISDVDRPLIIKVASISAARIQVYFIDNEDYFRRKQTYCADDGTFFADNDERAIFFARGVLETVKKLRWYPDVIHLHGWVGMLVGLYVKVLYKDEPAYRNSRIVVSLYDDDSFDAPFCDDFFERLRTKVMPAFDTEGIATPVTCTELFKLAVKYSDGVIINAPKVDEEVVSYARQTGKPVLDYPGEADYYSACNDFYTLVCGGDDGDEEEESFIIPRK